MNRNFLLLTALFFCSIGFSQTNVTGKIEGLHEYGAKEFYLLSILKQKNIDTIEVKGNEFSFSIDQQKPEYFLFNFDEQKMGFFAWIEKTDTIKISGNADELIPPKRKSDLIYKRVYNDLQKTGSQEQNIHDTFFKAIAHPFKNYLVPFHDNFNYLKDSSTSIMHGKALYEMKQSRKEIYKNLGNLITSHPNNQATQFAIWCLQKEMNIFSEEQNFELNKLIKLFVSPQTETFSPQ